ncbi:MAG: redoxin domain-containing protein [Candidatus Kaiserbacteria bacterium]|nr:redoxin domain-containing protein [Candidatus Kaiserbacteria bacterium]MCB9815790.1 redoxin domain-containing protein [Candidatus Nomurabacteria bacterium]
MEHACKCGEAVVYAPLTVGDAVPEELDFPVLHNDEEKQMSFKELRGKWAVLVFYPKDFTFICPTELEDMQKHYEAFTAEGAEVISVSTDTIEVHKAWHDNSPAIKTLTYPMAADPAHVLSEVFGVLIPEAGVTHRATFIIDPEGVIRCIEINHDAIGRSAKETLRKMKAAKHVNEHPGNVCPASWEEGDETLKPGLDLVGKI